MPEVILPNKSKGEADDNDFSDVYENDVAIKEVVEALTDDNIAAGAAISASKLAEEVLKLVATGTKRRISFGTQTLTFVADNFSDEPDVTHELGVEPKVALAVSSDPAVTVAVTKRDATHFYIKGFNGFAKESISVTVYWIAIG